MGNVTELQGKNGISFKAVAIHRNNRRYKTFRGARARTRANQWIVETETALRTGQAAPTAEQHRVTLGGAITAYGGVPGLTTHSYTRSQWQKIMIDLKAKHKGVLCSHSPTSWDKEISVLKKIAARFGLDFPMLSLTPDHILAWIEDMRDEGKADATIRNTIRQLQWLIRTATIELGVKYHTNPYDAALAILNHRGANLRYHQRERRISEDEYNALTNATHTHKTTIQLLIIFAIETAMRRGEIAAMTWQDINLKQRTVRLPKTKTDKKTGKAGRVVPLSPRAMEALAHVPKGDATVFGMEPDSITQAFQRVCDQVGITDLHFHDLRHEGVSRMFEIYGWGPDKVGAITGQSWITLKRYTHHRPEEIAKEMQDLHAPINGEWEEVQEVDETLQTFLLNKLENGDESMIKLLEEFESK